MEGNTAQSNTPIAPSNASSPAQSVPPQAPPPAEKPAGQRKLFAVIVAFLILVIVAVLGVFYLLNINNQKMETATTTLGNTLKIGLSLDTLAVARWTKDRDLMTFKAQHLGASVVTLVANSDDNTQIAQIRNLIAQNVKVIIIVAHNAQALSGVIDEAHQAGIKVIAYDRMILNSDVDFYVSFDSVKVGSAAAEYVMAAVPKTIAVPNVAFVGGSPTDNNAMLVRQGAMGVLEPLVKAGKAKIVFDQYTDNWDPTVAYDNMDKFLNSGGKVDAVIASNDGTAGGVEKALAGHGLSGKVPLSGQDAELTAVKRLLAGTQTVTLYKPIASEANKAIEVAIDLADGKAPQTTGVTNNGKINVPSFLLDPTPITKNTINILIKDGFYTHRDIYGGN